MHKTTASEKGMLGKKPFLLYTFCMAICLSSTVLCVFVPDVSSCASDEFSCTNGRCIKMDLKCNGKDDCLDSSDEQGCCKLSS